MKKIIALLLILLPFSSAMAKSSKDKTIGIMIMGNIQILDTLPNIDPGPGGGLYFDYRFNQRFSLTVDAWVTTHDGTGLSSGDNGILLMGIPTATLKLYVLDNDNSRWDPYIGIGVGVYALSEGNIGNGTSGLGLGAKIDVGFDYYLSDLFSVGFSGIFNSAGIITSLSNSGTNASAIMPYTLLGKVGYHF